FQPDLILVNLTGKKPTSGAMKFYLSKSKELDFQVGVWMASLLYQYRLNVANDPSTHCDLCMIYDVRKDEHHSAGKSHKKLFQNIDSACQIISAMWPTI